MPTPLPEPPPQETFQLFPWISLASTDNQLCFEAIAAVSPNGGLGLNNNLLYKNKEDMKLFKEKTINNIIIMGRKTWDSLPNRPLPNRFNIIISRSNDIKPPTTTSVDYLVFDVNSALEYLKSLNTNKKIIVIGGAQIYKEFLGLTSSITLHRFKEYREADTFFPDISNFKLTETKQTNFGFYIESYTKY